MVEKSIVQEAKDIHLAMELITLGARLQMLESETQLSRGRLIKLYKELRGSPPPKGMLPFSTDWFMTWEQNIHSSMFYNAYSFLLKAGNAPVSRPLLRPIVFIWNSVLTSLECRHYWR